MSGTKHETIARTGFMDAGTTDVVHLEGCRHLHCGPAITDGRHYFTAIPEIRITGRGSMSQVLGKGPPSDLPPLGELLNISPERAFVVALNGPKGEERVASRNREELQKQFEKDGKTRYVKTEDVDAEILTTQHHHFHGTTVTVCVISLHNGFTVVGKSACANPDNFETVLGESLAFEDAKQQMYALLAFRLCDISSN